MSVDWSTPGGLAAIREAFAGAIPGWADPVAFGVGISSASSTPDVEFPHVSGAAPSLPAVVMATVLGHSGGSETYELGPSQLSAAIDTLAPAEACTDVEHPNLAAWRQVLSELRGNPARAAYAVFVGDEADPPSSEADATLRTLLGQGQPPR